MYDIPDGIIAHLTRDCGGNVHDPHVVDMSCASFEKEIREANRQSGAYNKHPNNVARNSDDLENDSCFLSTYRHPESSHNIAISFISSSDLLRSETVVKGSQNPKWSKSSFSELWKMGIGALLSIGAFTSYLIATGTFRFG
jgi:hypothetical protein